MDTAKRSMGTRNRNTQGTFRYKRNPRIFHIYNAPNWQFENLQPPEFPHPRHARNNTPRTIYSTPLQETAAPPAVHIMLCNNGS